MKRDDEDPRVVDLRRYRKAAEARRTRVRTSAPARPNARPRPTGSAQGRPGAGGEPLLGSRPRAGLILTLIVVVLLALWLLPTLSKL